MTVPASAGLMLPTDPDRAALEVSAATMELFAHTCRANRIDMRHQVPLLLSASLVATGLENAFVLLIVIGW